jgi:hypothetical protein
MPTRDEASNLVVWLKSGATSRVLPYGEDGFSSSTAVRSEHEIERSESDSSGSGPTRAADIIYTSRSDMPSLEELLADYQIASAVFERESQHRHPLRLVTASAIAFATLTVGVVLLSVNLLSPTTPNALAALFLSLAGVVLVATVVLASRE